MSFAHRTLQISPNEACRTCQSAHLGDHVINEAMLVPDAQLFKFLLVSLRFVHLLEYLQEAPIVALQNGVFCAAQCKKNKSAFAIFFHLDDY
jgi:hypothetical protein